MKLRPLYIVHLDSELAWRGGQEALLNLARGLRDRGHTQQILCPPQSELARRLEEESLPYVPLTRSRELRWMLRRQPVDLLHAHSGRAQNVGFLASVGVALKRVVTRHVAFVPKYPRVHQWKYTLMCDGVIAVSEAVKRVTVGSGVPAEKIEVIHTGIEIPAPRERTPHAGFRIGHLGAFTSEKGQDVAIAAAALLREKLPEARWILAGDGPMLAEWRAKAGAEVEFPGFVDDPAAFYSSLDLFVMPSRSEAWGLAALHAMAHGISVIASDAGGLPEMIEDGVSGRLVPLGDPQALADAVLSAREHLSKMGTAARDRARCFSIERTLDKTEVFYYKMMNLGTTREQQS